MDHVRIFALGGLDEDGKNMYVVESNKQIFLIEAGSKYPEGEVLGIEFIIPDFRYLIDHKDRIQALFITHSHDDSMGSLSFLLKQIKIPIYTTPLSAKRIEALCEKENIKDVEIHRIKRSASFKINNTAIRTFGVTMSIPDGFGVAIDTPQGAVVYTSEFIIDMDNKNPNFSCDLVELAELGKKKILALLAESSSSTNPGFTAPNHKITHLIEPPFVEAKGRIILTTYEQNLFRIIEIIELANKLHRKILFYDESLRDMLRLVERLGYYHIPAGLEVTREKFRNDMENVLILVTGGGPTVFRKMFKIAMNSDSLIQMEADDTVIIASPVMPGAEVEAAQMENELYKEDIKVVSLSKKMVQSMHASQEDLKMMLYLFKPLYYIPIKGEYRQLVANANIALDMGIYAERIIVLDNGQIATFENSKLTSTSDLLDLEELMIDGNDNLDSTGFVLRDRETLSTDGVIIVGVVVNYATKEIIGGPDVQSRGLIYLKDADYIVKEVGGLIEATINQAVKENRYENLAVRQEAKEKITKYVLKETGKRPMILPAIIEINVSSQ